MLHFIFNLLIMFTGDKMKMIVNENCIGCGACERETESKVFKLNDNGLAEAIVNPVPEELESLAVDGKNSCPVDAIEEDSE